MNVIRQSIESWARRFYFVLPLGRTDGPLASGHHVYTDPGRNDRRLPSLLEEAAGLLPGQPASYLRMMVIFILTLTSIFTTILGKSLGCCCITFSSSKPAGPVPTGFFVLAASCKQSVNVGRNNSRVALPAVPAYWAPVQPFRTRDPWL